MWLSFSLVHFLLHVSLGQGSNSSVVNLRVMLPKWAVLLACYNSDVSQGAQFSSLALGFFRVWFTWQKADSYIRNLCLTVKWLLGSQALGWLASSAAVCMSALLLRTVKWPRKLSCFNSQRDEAAHKLSGSSSQARAGQTEADSSIFHRNPSKSNGKDHF